MRACRLTGKSKGEFQVLLQEGEAVMKATSDEEAGKWVEILVEILKQREADAQAEAEAAAAAAPAPAPATAPAPSPAPAPAAEAAMDAADQRALETLGGGMKPVWLTIEGAKDLPGVEGKDGDINPVVIVTMVSEGDDEDTPSEQLWMRFSRPESGSAPTYSWKLLIPGVLRSATLLFTVVDYTGQRMAFLGQGCWRVADDNTWEQPERLTLPLGEFGEAFVPKDGGGKALTFFQTDGAGAGELTIKIEPENSGLCCAIKKRGETQHWKDRWAVLAGDVIHYFGDKDEGASKATINLAEAKDITHPEDILELIDVETDEKTWHFRLETPEFGAAALNAFRLAAGKSAYAGTGVSIADQGGFQENVKVTQD